MKKGAKPAKNPIAQRDCVYVVGAGFSAGLGYPLTSDLLMRLWDRIDDEIKEPLQKVVAFHHPGFDPANFTSYPNIEQLLSEMLVNEELFDSSRQYEGNFTKKELAALQRNLLLKIADWFHELSTVVEPSNPKVAWLAKFRDRVRKENAAIISFNWDLILDELLFGDDISGTNYGFEETDALEPVLLKPHGSLNWFENELGKHLTGKKRELIFGREGASDAIYAFREFRAPISKVDRIYTPLIVPPVYLKNFQKPVFSTLWSHCTSALSTAKKIVFLGYSMPSADLHAQFIMRCGFHNQIEGELTSKKKRALATGPADVIIVNPDQGAALRIASLAGPKHHCTWKSTPVGDWVTGK